MNSDARRNSANNNTISTCFGKPRNCVVPCFILTVASLIFVTGMSLTVYLNHIASMDKIVVVLIVASCLLYLLSFISNMYHIWYGKPKFVSLPNGENSNSLNQAIGTLAQSSSLSRLSQEIPGLSHVRQQLRNTPPPPYEIQMSEMSRLLLPGTSRPTDSSTRESEINEEARKLIRRIYEDIKRVNQQVAQSPPNEQSMQQVVQARETPSRQKERISSKVSHPNPVVNWQETAVKSVATPGLQPADFRIYQATQQKMAENSLPTEFELQRSTISSEGFAAATPLPSIRREDILQVARKRKLTSLSKELQTKLKTTEQADNALVDGNETRENDIYERIKDVKTTRIPNSPHAAYEPIESYCAENEFEDSSEHASSVYSAASEPGPADQKRKFHNPNVKVRRQLSAPSSRKFRQLGKPPETVLDAIATCFDLTPDEWMVAWKLSHKGVSPIERARILGVRLEENPVNDEI